MDSVPLISMEQIGRPRAGSITYQEPLPPYSINFGGKTEVAIIIYTDNKAFGNTIKEYLKNKDVSLKLSGILNIGYGSEYYIEYNGGKRTEKTRERHIPVVYVIDNEKDLHRVIARENILNEEYIEDFLLRRATRYDELRDFVVFSSGKNATKSLLKFLYGTQDSHIVSAILFNPTLAYAKNQQTGHTEQLVPTSIRRRVYNFWSKNEYGVWRKIFPARNGEGPKLTLETIHLKSANPFDIKIVKTPKNNHFTGVNICTLLLDQQGKIVENFDFNKMTEQQFKKILSTIAKTNYYRLQTDLNSIIENNTAQERQLASQSPLLGIKDTALPLVTVRHAMQIDNDTQSIKAIINKPKLGFTEMYSCSLADKPSLFMQYKKTLLAEIEWSNSLAIKWGLNLVDMDNFALIGNNPYLPEKIGIEAVETVQEKVETYRLEKDYIMKRREQKVLPALRILCGENSHPINIAIVASGGGSRAMFATYGALKGLYEMGVLDATSYICGLSGSTWAISSIFTEVNRPNGAEDLNTAINNAIHKSIRNTPNFNFLWETIKSSVKNMAKYFVNDPTVLKIKKLCKQPIGVTDYYGDSIGQYLLGKGDQTRTNDYIPSYLTQQLGESARWQRKNYTIPDNYIARLPFPIYTAVTPIVNTMSYLYPWFEFTPYQIGTVLESGLNQKGMFVKTWAFGRKFIQGVTVDFSPEQSLEFYLGIFSSAMNSTLRETIDTAMSAYLSKEKVTGVKSFAQMVPMLEYVNIDYRGQMAEVLNPMYNKKGYAKFTEAETLGLIDAGFAFNLPFPPLNDYHNKRPERKPDVIIFIDASADTTGKRINISPTIQAWPNGIALRAVEYYARSNGISFPEIPEDINLALKTCSVYTKSSNPATDNPVVIYLPLTKDTKELINHGLLDRVRNENIFDNATPMNLNEIPLEKYETKYTNINSQDAVNLLSLMHYNVLYNADKIKNAIGTKACIDAKKPTTASTSASSD